MRPDAVRRVLDTELTAARVRRDGRAPRVLDVGGGSGVLAVPLAADGCVVTVVEPSPNALATLNRRAHEAGVADRVTALQGYSEALLDLVEPGSADVVLAHGLLEVVDDPAAVVAAMSGTLAPGGALSILVANRFAAVINRAITGRMADARHLLEDPMGKLTGPGEVLLRRFDSEGLRALLVDAGLSVDLLQGQGVIADLVPSSVLESHSGAADALAELEAFAATIPPLRDVATRLHAIARR